MFLIHVNNFVSVVVNFRTSKRIDLIHCSQCASFSFCGEATSNAIALDFDRDIPFSISLNESEEEYLEFAGGI